MQTFLVIDPTKLKISSRDKRHLVDENDTLAISCFEGPAGIKAAEHLAAYLVEAITFYEDAKRKMKK